MDSTFAHITFNFFNFIRGYAQLAEAKRTINEWLGHRAAGIRFKSNFICYPFFAERRSNFVKVLRNVRMGKGRISTVLALEDIFGSEKTGLAH